MTRHVEVMRDGAMIEIRLDQTDDLLPVAEPQHARHGPNSSVSTMRIDCRGQSTIVMR